MGAVLAAARATLTRNHTTVSVVRPAMGRVPQEWNNRGWIDYQGIRQRERERQAQQQQVPPPGQAAELDRGPSQGVSSAAGQPQQGPVAVQPVPAQGPSAAAQPVPVTEEQVPPGLLGASQVELWHYQGDRRQRPVADVGEDQGHQRIAAIMGQTISPSGMTC